MLNVLQYAERGVPVHEHLIEAAVLVVDRSSVWESDLFCNFTERLEEATSCHCSYDRMTTNNLL